MEELRNLQQMASLASGRFNQYDGEDFVLPEIFKEQVKEINSNTITYNKYSAIIETKGVQHGILNIFMPNQWFYIASYFTDFYNELQKYKKYALRITTKERLKELNGKELSNKELNTIRNLNIDDKSKNYLMRFITDYSWWSGAKTIDRGDFYVSPILSNANLVNASQSFVADLCAFLANKQDLVQAIINKEENDSINSYNDFVKETLDYSLYRPYITAIKSKPFLLLAGISGTGKSRIVRELARACWKEGTAEYEAQKPKNFTMIQVKPNWHDSSELMGYVSRVSGEPVYVAGDFLKFVAKAWENPDVPHFLCLDEMNLAPVEQYFAEYLSVIESRKNKEGKVVTDAILKPEFEKDRDPQTGNLIPQKWYSTLVDELLAECCPEKIFALKMQFETEGITIPQNLIVVGTVNMDETTFSFSRKVLDRAMTIEMNEVDLASGLDHRHEQIGLLGEAELIGTAVEGVDVYNAHKEVCDKVIGYLKAINLRLENTPFKIAYRTRNEALLYVVNNLPYNKDENDGELSQAYVIARALDEITNMKILSRIEGDETKIGTLLNDLKNTIKEQLTAISEETFPMEQSASLAKLNEMETRLKQGYTSFWS